MRKVITYILTISFIMIGLAGCGQKDEQQSNGVIINAGDNSSSTSSTDNTIGQIESNDNIDDTIQDNTDDYLVEEQEISLVGVWVDADNNVLNLYDDGLFDATLLNTSTYVSGTYETDNKTYIKIVYTQLEEIKNPTEEDLLLNNGYNTVEVELKLTLSDVSINFNDEKSTIKVNNVQMELYAEAPKNIVEDDKNNNESSGYMEIVDEKELERIKQELINQGINPDTGLTFEEEEKLIEMGIDPVTREPFATEEPTE